MAITLQNVSLAWPALREPLTCRELVSAISQVTQADRRLLVREGNTTLLIEAPPLDVFRAFVEVGAALFLRRESNTRAYLGGKAQQRLLVQRLDDRLQLTVEAGKGPAQKPLSTDTERFFTDLRDAAAAWLSTQEQAATSAQALAQEGLQITCADVRLLDTVAQAAQGATFPTRNEPMLDELERLDFVAAYKRIFGATPPFGETLPAHAKSQSSAAWLGPPLQLDLQPRERLLNWISEQGRHGGAMGKGLFCAYFAGGRLIAARTQHGLTSSFEDAWSMPRDSFAEPGATHERFSFFWRAAQDLEDGLALHYAQLSPLA